MKKRIGILSCNKYCNFTNYGSALQTYALQTAVDRIGGGEYEAVIMDYCPDTMLDKDILNPFKYMWDKDEESVRMCEMTMEPIRINNDKFNRFYDTILHFSANKYTSLNINESRAKEALSGYIVGSDTVFCLEEFNLDNGYFANFPEMKNRVVSYAASFGDSHFSIPTLTELNMKLKNFSALGLREAQMVPYVSSVVNVPVYRTIDPTLLLGEEDYSTIIQGYKARRPYVLIYVRRYNPEIEEFARVIAAENGYDIIEISLRATNCEKGHTMRYDAGVEEFLGLVKNAAVVVTNSFHGMIFAVQFRRPFYAFSRAQCDTKIDELLKLFGLEHRIVRPGIVCNQFDIDFDKVHVRIAEARKDSLDFLAKELEML